MWLALTAMADLVLLADAKPEPCNTQPWIAMRSIGRTVATGPCRICLMGCMGVLKEIRVWGTPQS